MTRESKTLSQPTSPALICHHTPEFAGHNTLWSFCSSNQTKCTELNKRYIKSHISHQIIYKDYNHKWQVPAVLNMKLELLELLLHDTPGRHSNKFLIVSNVCKMDIENPTQISGKWICKTRTQLEPSICQQQTHSQLHFPKREKHSMFVASRFVLASRLASCIVLQVIPARDAKLLQALWDDQNC